MAGRRRIIHPTDFSPGAAAALVRALETAKREGAELIFMHVIEPVLGLSDETDAARWMRMRAAAQAAARKRFARVLARAKKARVRASAVLLEGWPAGQITQTAKARGAGLIVMGTHGRTGLSKLLVGSVAQQVIATAPCPVLTVRVK